jgi:hypothetical protein
VGPLAIETSVTASTANDNQTPAQEPIPHDPSPIPHDP